MKRTTSFTCASIHFRSSFSLLKGCLAPEDICDFAQSRGYPSVGMTDINNMYGLIRFIKAAKRAGIKPVSGVVVCTGGKELFTAYIMNRAGFSRLCRVVSEVLFQESPYIKEEYRGNRDPAGDLLENGWEGLSVVSDNFSVLQRLMLRSKKGLFVKLTWGKSYIAQLRWAKKHGLPVIALNTAVVLHTSDIPLYHLLRAIDLNTTTGNLPEDETLMPWQRAAGVEEIESFFSAVPGAIQNARELAEKSHVEEIVRTESIFPWFGGFSGEQAFSRLVSLCKKGISRRYGRIRPDISERLHYELAIIKEKHFSSYFLVVHDIVSRCPRTCGRGSSAASIVSYLLGITHIDPLQYNLFFERFLNPGRKDPPDIDVDFPWDERDKVLEYVFRKYKGRSGMVANHVTFGMRSSIREPAKALGIPEEEIKKFTRLWRLGREQEIPGYLRDISRRIRGFPHYIGLHCGGVVITPGPITDYTHVQVSLVGYPVIAWEKEGTEDAGLVKIDLLGNRSLAVLRDTISLIKTRYGKTIPWETFHPLTDKRANDLIREGQTVGIFYVESPATRQLLKKMKTGDFEHLVIASSIIRPAANKYIREFVKRLRTGTYVPLHPLIADTLRETLGIMVYQEDVSRVAIDLAGFSVEEADSFRKIISKKEREHHLADYKTRFFSGGRSRGVPDSVLCEVWNMILSFKGYSFCKAHSASYALVSYKLAYLKAYYPLEFMASVINNGGGFYSRQTYLNELKRMGCRVLGPDVTKSEYMYSIEDQPGGNNAEHPGEFPGTGRISSLRVGLHQLGELSRNFTHHIIDTRKKKPFTDLRDFCKRVKPGLPEMRILIRSGALDSLSGGVPRPALFWLYFHVKDDNDLFLLPPIPSFITDYPRKVKLRDEAETLGMIISRHPLTIFSKRIIRMQQKKPAFPLITSREIPKFINRKVRIAGLVVTGKEVITKKNEMMTFVSFEDPHSIYETVFFPGSFTRHHALLDGAGIYLISGKVEEDQGAVSINVEGLERVSRGGEER